MHTLYSLFRRQAEGQPHVEAVVTVDRRISYGELANEVERVARGLYALGVRRGDRVLTLAGNVPDVIAIYLAAGKLGAIYVPVSAGFREREVRFVLGNARPRVAIVQESLVEDFVNWADGVDLDLVVLGGGVAGHAGGLHAFDSFAEGVPDPPEQRVGGECGAVIFYTSGTTSTPKAVLHSQASEAYNATVYGEVWGLRPGDRGVVCLPLAWAYGLSTTTAALLVSGATVLLLDRFHPALVLDAVEEHRATALWGTMSMYTKLLEVIVTRERVDLTSLRVVSNGGEPCPPPLVAEFEERTGLQLLGSYALSEARPVMVVRPGSQGVPEGTAGQLVPGAELRLENESGRQVPDGTAGHALVRCGGMMTEYYGEPVLTAERLTEDGWLKTGDLLVRDATGYYFVVGRLNEMIIRSGVNIAPAEIESALLSHPDIADAAVVGVPDSRSGEAIRAYLVTASGVQLDEAGLAAFIGSQLASFKIPQQWTYVDHLPRTDRGKLDRAHLRRLATESGDAIMEKR